MIVLSYSLVVYDMLSFSVAFRQETGMVVCGCGQDAGAGLDWDTLQVSGVLLQASGGTWSGESTGLLLVVAGFWFISIGLMFSARKHISYGGVSAPGKYICTRSP